MKKDHILKIYRQEKIRTALKRKIIINQRRSGWEELPPPLLESVGVVPVSVPVPLVPVSVAGGGE